MNDQVKKLREEHGDLLAALRSGFESGVLPRPDFPDTGESAGRRGKRREPFLERLDTAAKTVRMEVLLEDYVERLAYSAGIELTEAMFALGYPDDATPSALNEPSATTAEATVLLGIPPREARYMMLAACLPVSNRSESKYAMAARKDEQTTYPYEEIDRLIAVAKHERRASVLERIRDCELAINRFFRSDE